MRVVSIDEVIAYLSQMPKDRKAFFWNDGAWWCDGAVRVGTIKEEETPDTSEQIVEGAVT